MLHYALISCLIIISAYKHRPRVCAIKLQYSQTCFRLNENQLFNYCIQCALELVKCCWLAAHLLHLLRRVDNYAKDVKCSMNPIHMYIHLNRKDEKRSKDLIDGGSFLQSSGECVILLFLKWFLTFDNAHASIKLCFFIVGINTYSRI